MYGDWIIAKGSSIGRRHIEDNMPCQDANNVFYDHELDYGIAVVSDGAGSAIHSKRGSNLIVNQIIEIIRGRRVQGDFSDFWEADKQDTDKFFIDAFQTMYKQLNDHAQLNGLPVKSLAATIIIVLFNKSGIICSHIGDGRAGFQDLNDNWFPILEPYKGEEANQTVFLTSDIWNNPRAFIRTTIVKQPIQSFTLLSDGCENATFELNRFNEKTQLYEKLNNPYSKFFNPNINILRELHNTGKTASEIDELWAIFLASGNTKFEAEVDDKTLILGTIIKK